MQMTLLPTLGLVLIVLGAFVLWRDIRKSRRIKDIGHGPGHDNSNNQIGMAEVTISRRKTFTRKTSPADNSSLPLHPDGRKKKYTADDSPLSQLRRTIEQVRTELNNKIRPSKERSETVEHTWRTLQERTASSVQDINEVLANVQLTIEAAGQPGWSLSNAGYGSFRRITLAGESVGWLRLELTNEEQLFCSFKAHGDDRSALNHAARIPARHLTTATISSLVTKVLQPLTKYATQNSSEVVISRDVAKNIWRENEELVRQAIAIANNALEESGARIVDAQKATWIAKAGRYRLDAELLLQEKAIDRLHIEHPDARYIECFLSNQTTVATTGQNPHSARLDRLSAEELAEMFIDCAWPAIETAWNKTQRNRNIVRQDRDVKADG